MATFTASKNFNTSGGAAAYRLDLTIVTTQISTGTEADITITATHIRDTGSLAFDSDGIRAYSTPGGRVSSGNLAESGSATWSYDFRPTNFRTISVWNFKRYYLTSYGSSANISLTITGGAGTVSGGYSSSFLYPTTISRTIDLFVNSTVPSLIGQTTTTANSRITTAGLTVGTVTPVNTTDQTKNNIVFEQSPTSGQSVAAGSSVDYSYNVYVAPTLYSVTFNDDNVNNTNPSALSVESGSTFTLPSAGSKTGQYYQWQALIGGIYFYRNGGTTSPTVTSNQSWTAIWSYNSYTLTYNANGGSVSPTSKTVQYTSTYGTLPTPTRSGYSFNGWFTASTGGSQVSSSTQMAAGNVTIYAQWTINTPGFTDENISQSLVINQDFSTVADRTVSATNATSYSITYAGTGLNPTGWLSINSSGQLSGSTNIAGTYYFFITATGAGGSTPTGTKTITVSYPGERFINESSTSGISQARRYDGSSWVPVTHMQRFDGTTWKNITN